MKGIAKVPDVSAVIRGAHDLIRRHDRQNLAGAVSSRREWLPASTSPPAPGRLRRFSGNVARVMPRVVSFSGVMHLQQALGASVPPDPAFAAQPPVPPEPSPLSQTSVTRVPDATGSDDDDLPADAGESARLLAESDPAHRTTEVGASSSLIESALARGASRLALTDCRTLHSDPHSVFSAEGILRCLLAEHARVTIDTAPLAGMLAMMTNLRQMHITIADDLPTPGDRLWALLHCLGHAVLGLNSGGDGAHWELPPRQLFVPETLRREEEVDRWAAGWMERLTNCSTARRCNAHQPSGAPPTERVTGHAVPQAGGAQDCEIGAREAPMSDACDSPTDRAGVAFIREAEVLSHIYGPAQGDR